MVKQKLNKEHLEIKTVVRDIRVGEVAGGGVQVLEGSGRFWRVYVTET